MSAGIRIGLLGVNRVVAQTENMAELIEDIRLMVLTLHGQVLYVIIIRA